MSMKVSKISPSASGVTISGSAGGQKGSVGIDTDGGIKLGLDIGIGKVGIDSDYGGSISVGFGGQNIIWGREGGKIHYNLGGFEVIVEARNCVVTETKKITGMVVAQRTYPDPGCKLPPDPEPEPPEPPPPNSGDPVTGVEVPNTDTRGWVFVHIRYWGAWRQTQNGLRLVPESFARREITSAIDENRPAWVGATPFDMSETYTHESSSVGRPYLIPKRTPLWIHGITVKDEASTAPFGEIPTVAYHLASSLYFSGDASPLFLWGTFSEIREFLRIKKQQESIFATKKSTIPIKEYIPYACIPFVDTPKVPLLPPLGGNRPPMPDSCCEALKADIEDIKEVLATKEMLGKKLKFPWRLRMPGGEGDEVITDYPNLARAIAQMIDHLGIHPPKLSIKDINNAVAGNQSINNQFPSATQGFEALMAQVWDANADVDTLTNFLYRLSWLCVQQSMNLARISADIQAITDMIGGETELDDTTITTPFNIGAGVEEDKNTRGKGFGKKQGGAKIAKSIDTNTELSTEALLPDFLKIRENPIVIKRFAGKKDVYDLLAIIVLKLQKLENR